MDMKNIILWIIMGISIYFFCQNYDFETHTLKTSKIQGVRLDGGSGPTQQSEAQAVKNNI